MTNDLILKLKNIRILGVYIMDNVFDYEDIQLIPAKCIVESRSECDTSVTLGGHTFKLPVSTRKHANNY